MACGGSDITGEDLATAPVPAEETAAQLLDRTKPGRDMAPISEKFGGDDHQMFYSAAAGTPDHANRTEYFVGPDGSQTYKPDRHVHVVHDDADPENEVVIVTITDRTHSGEFHPFKQRLLRNPSGNEVNDAISKAVEIMNSRQIGERNVSY